ncbi:MAG: O-antigen ligase family protein [Acidobacteriota bacterium]|nr:O-antigen ligase family protein [Acidobacteriota bacterium]
MTNLPLLLYIVFFLVAVFAPLRWSIVGFILLATIDLGSVSASIGLLNTAKAMILPVFMLWRFRAYAGHSKIEAAPIAWGLLIAYVAIASIWSVFPMYAIKLIGHMTGSLVICMALLRATKGGYLTPQWVLVPVTAGTIGVAAIHWFLLHAWGGEPERFTTFAGAQACAAFLLALYCAALASRSIRPAIRITLSAALAMSVVFNGSRLWMAGLCLITLLTLFLSSARAWIKVLTFGVSVILAVVAVAEWDTIMNAISRQSGSNRIAAAISAAYEGNTKARGLGTYTLRQALYRSTVESIESGAVLEVLFGHGTCNGALIAAAFNKNPDPNRALHNEWLRAIYEWGIPGFALWLVFMGSLFIYAAQGFYRDKNRNSVPLLIYLPAFALGLSGENFIAAAGNVASMGLLMLIAFASISHRRPQGYGPGRATRLKGGRPIALQTRAMRPQFSGPQRLRATL